MSLKEKPKPTLEDFLRLRREQRPQSRSELAFRDMNTHEYRHIE